jgi:hypothetical protein
MTIGNLLLENAEWIRNQLNTFVEHYEHMSDEVRMTRTSELFESLRQFFQAQSVLINTARKQDPRVTEGFRPYQQAERAIFDIYEHMLMIHVDEPNERFLQQMEDIRREFQPYLNPDYLTFVCAIDHTLDEATETQLMRDMKKAMAVS